MKKITTTQGPRTEAERIAAARVEARRNAELLQEKLDKEKALVGLQFESRPVFTPEKVARAKAILKKYPQSECHKKFIAEKSKELIECWNNALWNKHLKEEGYNYVP